MRTALWSLSTCASGLLCDGPGGGERGLRATALLATAGYLPSSGQSGPPARTKPGLKGRQGGFHSRSALSAGRPASPVTSVSLGGVRALCPVQAAAGFLAPFAEGCLPAPPPSCSPRPTTQPPRTLLVSTASALGAFLVRAAQEESVKVAHSRRWNSREDQLERCPRPPNSCHGACVRRGRVWGQRTGRKHRPALLTAAQATPPGGVHPGKGPPPPRRTDSRLRAGNARGQQVPESACGAAHPSSGVEFSRTQTCRWARGCPARSARPARRPVPVVGSEQRQGELPPGAPARGWAGPRAWTPRSAGQLGPAEPEAAPQPE